MRIKVPVSLKGMHMFLLKSKNAACSTALSRVTVLTFLAVVFLSNLTNEACGAEGYGRFLGVTKWKGNWTIDFAGGGTVSSGNGDTYTYKITGSSKGNFTLDFEDSDPKMYIKWGSAPADGTGGLALDATWVRSKDDITTYKITTPANGSEKDTSACGLCVYIKNGNYFFQAPGLLFDGTYTESGDSPLTIPFTQYIPPTPVPPTGDWLLKRWNLPATGLKISDSVDYIYNYQLPGVVIDVALPIHVTWNLIPADEPTLEITKLEQKPKSKIASTNDMVYKNGRLTYYAEATVKPEKYAKYVEWEIPSFGDVAPARIQKKFKKGIASVRVSYNKMPADNGGFGEKTIKATLKDFDLEASKTFRVFFDRDGKKNPEGKTRNWYYLN